jgi:Tfp pilus assembly protein PilW
MSARPRSQAGITLVELLVSIVVVTLITGGIASAMLSAMNIFHPTNERTLQTSDAQTIAAFLTRDAQAAGGTDPNTASLDATYGLGVSTSDAGGCVSGPVTTLTAATGNAGGITTLPVASAAGFSSSGGSVIAQHLGLVLAFTYTGITGNNLTGVALVSGTSTTQLSSGDAVSLAASPGSLLLRFKWFDRTQTLSSDGQQQVVAHVSNYYFAAASNQIVRSTCDSGATAAAPSAVTLAPATNTTLASTISNVTAGCSPAACPSLPDSVSLTVTAAVKAPGSQDPITSPYTYTLTASLRPESQTAPCDATDPSCTTPTGTVNPLLALGGQCNNENVSGLDVGGNSTVDVNGGITLSNPTAGCNATHIHQGSNGRFEHGVIVQLTQVVDPYAGLAPPPDNCSTATGNPATSTIGGVIHYQPGTYKTDPTISGNVTVVFDPGIYVFCNGLTISSANTTVSGTNVLLYIKGGTLSASGGSLDLTGRTSSSDPYFGLLIWQSALDPNNTVCILTPSSLCQTPTPMSLTGNGVLNLKGTVYAPKTEVDVRGNSGTPFVKAIIAASVSFSGSSGITIGTPPPTLSISTPTSLPSWTVGVPYPNTTFTGAGGSGGNSWSVSNLPAGLTFNPANATISGTPTTAQLYSPVVTLTDSDGDQVIANYSVTIYAALTITGPSTLPSADVSHDYPPPSQTAVMTAVGGTPPFTWSATGLPDGLNIGSSSGAITGNPTTVSTYSPTIKITDGIGATATKSYSNIAINPAPSITAPTSTSLPSWTTGQSGYSQQITVSGGTGPFVWQLSGGPSGLSINSSGLITGTPTGPQTYAALIVTATDADGVPASQSYSITINPSLSISGTIPDGEINIAYSATLSANSGTAPYHWSWSPVPPGLSLDPNSGAITGTPTSAATYTPTVTVTDSGGATVNQSYAFVINPKPSIKSTSLPSWTKDQDYGNSHTTMSGSGGLTPYTWSATGLPTGLSIDPSTGSITGTPTVVGSSTVVVTLTDSKGVQDTQSFGVTINPRPSISTTSLPDGEANAPYSATISIADGTQLSGGGYNWTASTGLPAGLTISSAGVITGPPTASGSFTVTVVATDAAGATASVPISLLISPAPVNQLSLSNTSGGNSLLVGTTLYYQGSTAGSFTITNNISTGGTAVSSNFPGLGGTTTGFTHAGGTVSSPSGGPFVSSPFSWSSGTTSSPTETVTGADSFGGAPTTQLNFVNDSTAPTGGALTVNGVAANGAGSTSTTTNTGFTLGPRTDYAETQSASASGLASSVLTVQSTTLSSGVCGALGSGGAYPSPTVIAGTANPAIVAGFCYVYTLTGTDKLGNFATIKTTVHVNPTLTAIALVIANGTGTAGTAEAGDTVSVRFDKAIQLSSVCSSWSSSAQTVGNITVTMNGGNGQNTNNLTIAGGTVGASACTGGTLIGSFTTTSNGYETGNKTHTFTGSTLSWNSGTNSLVLTLGSCSGGANGCPPNTVASSTYTFQNPGTIALATDPGIFATGNPTTGAVKNF